MSFEEHLARAVYDGGCKDRARRKRADDRRMTREQLRDRQRRVMVWLTLGCFILALLLTFAAAVPIAKAEAEEDSPDLSEETTGRLPGDDTPATERCYLTDEEIEATENEMIEVALLARATRIDDAVVTHYAVCVECCGKTDGITASGLIATPYVSVAVDPSVIPLGSDVLVDYGDGTGLHYYRADDVGGAVKGNHIDLCVTSYEEAIELGTTTATVYWVAPES